MTILIGCIIILLIIAMMVWGEGYLTPPLDPGIVRIMQALTIIVGALLMLRHAALL